ncbi:MAG: oligosaccharide flippase family protein [Lachnospiraceae bacterium]|nr:oligosaccharide flippase family protein [Lachnospiraceae bacterium]
MNNPLKAKWQSLSKPAQASLAIICCRVFQMGISVLFTPVFTRLMTTGEYGVYTVIFSWLEVIAVFSTLNLSDGSFQQALVKYNTRKNDLMAAAAGLGTATSIVVFGVYFLLHQWLNPLLGFDTLICGCMIILAWAGLMCDIWTSVQKNEYKYKAKIAVSVFVAIAEPLIGIAAVFFMQENKAEVRFFSVVLVETITYGGFFFYLVNKGRFYDKKLWGYFLTLNIPLIPHYLTGIILNQTDRIMIKSLVGDSEAGIYGLGHNWAWMLFMITSAVLHSMHPWIFKRIKEHEIQKIAKTSYGVLILIAIAGSGIISITPEVLYILAPADYHLATKVIVPLVGSVYFMFAYNLFCCFEFYYEKTKLITVVSSFAGILNIFLNYVLIGKFGWTAAGYTTLFCHACLAAAHFIIANRISRKENSEKVFNPVIILIISVLLLLVGEMMVLLYDHMVIRYVIILTGLFVMLLKRDCVKNIINAIR